MSEAPSRFIITGAKGGKTQNADAPNRLEINDLIEDKDQFSLYIQALGIMYSVPQDNDLSFFGIGGIHGLPYVPWNGSTGSKSSTEKTSGYCHHGSNLFPTWHRPYFALFEQVLQTHATAIAEKYADKERWRAAAAKLRAPYWDWAVNSVPPPEVISLKSVTILTPDGRTTSVPNPLLEYRFNPIDKSFPEKFRWPTTRRHPRADGTSNIEKMKQKLAAMQDGITTKTYHMLANIHTWPAFSNHSVGDSGSNSNSLEAIHDGIHNFVGGGGSMSEVAISAFDPIFFLHHANVDRMLSLWSALNPTVWVSEGKVSEGTFTIPMDSKVNTNTPLTPFWDSQDSYWASLNTTITSRLGYTYPEFNGVDMGNPNAVKNAIERVVNQLYGAGGGQNLVQATTPESYYDWTACVRVKKYVLGGSFDVLIFLGSVPEDVENWHSSSSFVGSHHAFVNSVADQCENCRSQADLVIEGFVHLNSAIARLSGLESFDPLVVEPWLKKNLSWRVQKVDGSTVAIDSSFELEVVVSDNLLTLEPSTAFPTQGACRYHHGITADCPGSGQLVT